MENISIDNIFEDGCNVRLTDLQTSAEGVDYERLIVWYATPQDGGDTIQSYPYSIGMDDTESEQYTFIGLYPGTWYITCLVSALDENYEPFDSWEFGPEEVVIGEEYEPDPEPGNGAQINIVGEGVVDGFFYLGLTNLQHVDYDRGVLWHITHDNTGYDMFDGVYFIINANPNINDPTTSGTQGFTLPYEGTWHISCDVNRMDNSGFQVEYLTTITGAKFIYGNPDYNPSDGVAGIFHIGSTGKTIAVRLRNLDPNWNDDINGVRTISWYISGGDDEHVMEKTSK